MWLFKLCSSFEVCFLAGTQWQGVQQPGCQASGPFQVCSQLGYQKSLVFSDHAAWIFSLPALAFLSTLVFSVLVYLCLLQFWFHLPVMVAEEGR